MVNARNIVAVQGKTLNTDGAPAPLTSDQSAALREINERLKAEVAGKAENKRKAHAERVRAEVTERGEDPESVAAVVENLRDADARGVLNGRHALYLDDGRIVTVANVIANRPEFHRVTCSDPLAPNHGGRNKAIIFTDGYRIRLFSHAHGGRLYTLAYDEQDFVVAATSLKAGGMNKTAILAKLLPDSLLTPAKRTELTRRLTVTLTKASRSREDDTSLDKNPAINALMDDFNTQFAIVAEGASVGVVRLAFNAELCRSIPVTMTVDAFKLLFGNRYINLERKDRDGEIEYQAVPATTVWLKHENRRTCPDGFGIDPTGALPATCFNLWQGFGVKPKKGDWTKLGGLIFEVLAAGNENHFEYIIHWLAHLAQRPHENPGVALVFRGEEGTGKGTFARGIMRLLRPHAMQISQPKHLTGAFNAHMRTVLLLFADEAFFAGDRSNEGTLKALITEEFRINEAKGRDAALGRNRIHLIMSSNEAWVVPASAEARRFAVFDVSPRHKQDLTYFKAVNDEMDVDGAAEGIAALLYDLLHFPLDMNIVRKAPETVGLHAQRIASLRGPARWLFDVLTRGSLGVLSGQRWNDTETTEDLVESYRLWSRNMKEVYPADEYAVGKVLASIFKSHRPRVKDLAGSNTRPPSYRLGTLEGARAAFAKEHGIGDAWPPEADQG